MNTQIYNAVLALINAGGPIALWGIGIWLILGLIRCAVICLTVWAIVRIISQTISVNYKISKDISTTKVTLLSEAVSKRFSDSLDNFLRESSAILKDLQKALEDSKKDSTKI